MIDDPAAIRRFAGWALVAGLSIAAGAAILALLTGDFGDVDVRVVLSSIGFAFLSSTASSGASLRLRSSELLRLLGATTLGLSVAAFALLLLGLWTNIDDWGSEGIWRAFGSAAVLSVAGSHACLVLAARRETDGHAVRTLAGASLVLGVLDAIGALLPISGLVDDVDEAAARIFGTGLVLLLLTSVLPPILRRIARSAPAPHTPAATRPREEALTFLASEVVEIADRIEALNRDPGVRAPEIRVEIERLRNLARAFQN
jgi:hypothetical protein